MNTKKDINIRVGANIQRERERAGLTQEKFSEMIGLGSKSLSCVERGVVGVSLTTLDKICRTLSVSSDTLLFGRGPETDVRRLAERLARLDPEQLRIADAVLSNLLAAFALGGSDR